jgi:hypothetical protein
MRNRNGKLCLAAILVIVLCIGAAAALLHAQKHYSPPDTVRNVNLAKSQVYLTGNGYRIDKGQKKLNKKLENRKEKRQKSVKTVNQNSSGNGDANGTSGKISINGGNGKSDETIDPNVDPDVEKNHDPTISTNLRNGQTVSGIYVSFYIIPKDYRGRHITAFDVTILVNGTRITSTGDDGSRISYRADLNEGVNSITVTAKDKYGSSITITRSVKCESSGKPKVIGTVNVSVDGSTIGLGTIVSGSVEIYKGDQLSYVLDRFLKAKGYGYGYTGSLSSAFYLASIKKTGIATSAEVPEALRKCVEEAGLTIKGSQDNAIAENDFVHGSGWMYSINGDYPSRGLSEYVPSDEDNIVFAFSLHDGKDIKHIWDW